MEKAILVGTDIGVEKDYLQSLKELEELALACEIETVGTITQVLDAPHKAYYIGQGKVMEVGELARQNEADLIIFDNSLSSTQMRNLQDTLEMPIMDRSSLILDIFAARARSREAKLQVEVARLQYMLPRLVGMHQALSRQGGGSGAMSNKGAGEKKLELDRRYLENRLTELRKELKDVSKERETQRKKRAQAGIPRVALVGYTNAGKSTLLNGFLDHYNSEDLDIGEKKVFEKDMLFATLDTTVRKITPPGHHAMLLSDTVGFIHKLPHHLVEAFHSTLEEAKEADVLLHVIDYSDPQYKEHMEVTKKTLEELGAGNIPMIYVYNKADLVPQELRVQKPADGIFLSAKKRQGLDDLIVMIEEKLAGDFVEAEFLIPYTDGAATAYLNTHGVVKNTEYEAEGTRMLVHCRKEDFSRFNRYVIG